MLNSNQRLIGSGRGATILDFAPASGVTVAVRGVGDMIEVADLTIDGNVTSGSRSGIELVGSNCCIRNVEVVEVGGGSSAFGCRIAGPNGANNYVLSGGTSPIAFNP